jgi:hypothetical protein
MRSESNLDNERRKRRPHPPARPAGLDQHRLAVVQAEARRLARILQPFGVLRKDQLKRRARATAWHEGGFDAALKTAIESGEIEPLPLGFYGTPGSREHSHPAGSGPGAA